ncbi:MAG: hypothetical protein AAB907_01430 [Patescibacteria group bacterium]
MQYLFKHFTSNLPSAGARIPVLGSIRERRVLVIAVMLFATQKITFVSFPVFTIPKGKFEYLFPKDLLAGILIPDIKRITEKTLCPTIAFIPSYLEMRLFHFLK